MSLRLLLSLRDHSRRSREGEAIWRGRLNDTPPQIATSATPRNDRNIQEYKGESKKGDASH